MPGPFDTVVIQEKAGEQAGDCIGVWTATFPEDFIGFAGHFPGQPILPGFLHLELVLEILRRRGHPAILKSVAVAKFQRSIAPAMLVEVRIKSVTQQAGHYEAELLDPAGSISTFVFEVSAD